MRIKKSLLRPSKYQRSGFLDECPRIKDYIGGDTLSEVEYAKYLLKNYHEIKGQISHFKELIILPFFEDDSETIEELAFKNNGQAERGRRP